jgi:hypothetical protein
VEKLLPKKCSLGRVPDGLHESHCAVARTARKESVFPRPQFHCCGAEPTGPRDLRNNCFGPSRQLSDVSARASRTTRGGWTRGCWTVLTVNGVEMVSSFRIWSGTPSGSLEQMFRPEIIETPNSRAETFHSMETNEPNRSNSQSHFWCCRHVHCGAILRDFFN